MAAGHQQSDKGETGSGIREKRGQEVSLEVMNADHRDAERIADRVSDRNTNEQRTRKTRALGHGDSAKVSAGLSSLFQHFISQC